MALTSQLPRMLQGTAPALAMSQIAQFGIRGGQGGDDAGASFEARVRRGRRPSTERHGPRSVRRDQDAEERRPVAVISPRTAPSIRAARSVRRCGRSRSSTKSNVGLEVAFADVGGWDTHVNQGAAQGQLATRLDDFARAIAALVADLGDRMEDTVVLTMSEFGRAVDENGNRGTDHGHGNAMLVIGGGVRGGRVYGKWPGLAAEQRYEGRDLAVTTDFRDVFGEIVVRHLGVVEPEPIFPGYNVQPSRFPGLFA